MDTKKENIILALLSCFICGIGIGGMITRIIEQPSDREKEAVARCAARWTFDKEGVRHFEWNTNLKPFEWGGGVVDKK